MHGHHQQAIDAIKKKLLGNPLTYSEVFTIMDEIAHNRLGPVLTTYFAAAGAKEGFNEEELFFLTKAMVETGPRLSFPGIVADKHSIGGVPGTRTTLIVVPIIAAAGFQIPKNSSRAITSPAGTADTMEVLAPVNFYPPDVERIVQSVGGCIVWGGHLGLAPADDVMIAVEEPLSFESYDKAIVAILAKKIASGATHVVFDIPVGKTLKVQDLQTANLLAVKLTKLANRFSLVTEVDVNKMSEGAGAGIGPVLEAKDALKVLEQDPQRPMGLEKKSIHLAGRLLALCRGVSIETGEEEARSLLLSKRAHSKAMEIVRAQGGNPYIQSHELHAAPFRYEVLAPESGSIAHVDNKVITIIARILGCPRDHAAGLYFSVRTGDDVQKGDILCTLYAHSQGVIAEAKDTLQLKPICEIV